MRGVLRFDNPHVVLFLRPDAVEVGVEVCELVGEDVGVWNDVESLLAELLLHLDNVLTEAVLPGQLRRVREMINLLIFVKIVVDVLLLGLTRPEHVPVVSFSLSKAIRFED